MMFPVQAVDVISAVKAPVHNQINLVNIQEIKVCQHVLDSLYIGDITGQFAVVKRQIGLLPKKQSQV
jgi:hypothetical protein